jgi:hypothetical protein
VNPHRVAFKRSTLPAGVLLITTVWVVIDETLFGVREWHMHLFWTVSGGIFVSTAIRTVFDMRKVCKLPVLRAILVGGAVSVVPTALWVGLAVIGGVNFKLLIGGSL